MGRIAACWVGKTRSVSRTQTATRIRRVASSLGLLPAAFYVWRALRDSRPSLVRSNLIARRRAPKSVPIPPAKLLYAIAATRSVEWFLQTGEQAAEAFRSALSGIGRPIESFESVLDFGCGCGRVLRQWIDANGPIFYGTDYNPKLVKWAQDNLPFDVRKNDLEPPLSYADESFDLCYAISVFTHLPENMQEPWLKELHRVMKQNGILLVTLSGEGDLVRTTAAEQDAFHNGELVVLDGRYAGTNMCGVYHSEAYVRKNWRRYFELLRFLPEGAKGSPRQDLYVLRRTHNAS